MVWCSALTQTTGSCIVNLHKGYLKLNLKLTLAKAKRDMLMCISDVEVITFVLKL